MRRNNVHKSGYEHRDVATIPAEILPRHTHESSAMMSSNRSDPASQYRLKPSCCPSCSKAGILHERRESGDRSRKLTYAERVAQQHCGPQHELDARPKRAQTISAVIRTRPQNSHSADQDSNAPQRAATARHKRAHQDLRRTALYCNKPLPPLLAEAACQEPSLKCDSQCLEESHSGSSKQHESKRSKLDELVQNVKGIAGRCKSRYSRYTTDVRLSMAWEVEEMI
jgi:hypothetical protein